MATCSADNFFIYEIISATKHISSDDTHDTADDKPAVVVTHGDRLTAQQRMHVRNELVELLGIPLQQIFDISGNASLLSYCFLKFSIMSILHCNFYTGCDDYETDLSVLDMLRYCIQHAEQNFPIKKNYLLEVCFLPLYLLSHYLASYIMKI